MPRVKAVSTVTPRYPQTVLELPDFATDSQRRGRAARRTVQGLDRADAYEEAGVGPDDLSLAEVYDLSTALELDWYENIGLCAEGEAEALLRSGATTIGGRIPVNPSGGLSCFGEAIPAQAIAQVCEVTWQLRGEAERPPGRRGHRRRHRQPGTVRARVVRDRQQLTDATDDGTNERNWSNMAEAYIVDAVRSPSGDAAAGSRRSTRPTSAPHSIKALVERTGIDPGAVDDVVFGNVDSIGPQAGDIARTCWLVAGLPEHVPGTTIDRQCGSAQQAVHFAAQAVMSGHHGPRRRRWRAEHEPDPDHERDARRPAVRARDAVLQVPRLAGALRRPGGVAVPRRRADRREVEHLARRHGGVRGRVPRARAAGPRRGPVRARDRAARRLHVRRRPREPNWEKIRSLPTLTPGGRLTAAVSSQISDASAALLIAGEQAVKDHGLTPRARIHHLSVRADDPVFMLTAPIAATEYALQKTGMGVDDIDLVEINEAFASVVLAWQQETGFDLAKVNVNGGAIALGHPLGATGARLMTTLLNELERTGGRYGLQTMCEGGGQANVTIIERL